TLLPYTTLFRSFQIQAFCSIGSASACFVTISAVQPPHRPLIQHTAGKMMHSILCHRCIMKQHRVINDRTRKHMIQFFSSAAISAGHFKLPILHFKTPAAAAIISNPHTWGIGLRQRHGVGDEVLPEGGGVFAGGPAALVQMTSAVVLDPVHN